MELIRKAQSSNGNLRFDKNYVIASEIAEQFYCEEKLDLEYAIGKVETEVMREGTQLHEKITEDYLKVSYKEVWENIITCPNYGIAEMSFFAEYKEILVGKPDFVMFENGDPLLLFEYKFSKYKQPFPSYEVQGKTYGFILNQLGFNTDSLYYAIVIASRTINREQLKKMDVPNRVLQDFRNKKLNKCNEVVLNYGETSAFLRKFQLEDAQRDVDNALEYWRCKRDPLKTDNKNKCNNCAVKKQCDVSPIIEELKTKLGENLIAIYGIGSFFDVSLPEEFQKGDVDVIAVVKSIESLPKQTWTETRYDTSDIRGIPALIHFNSLDSYQAKETFERQSWSNYEWSVVELKNPKNSMFLYGTDIRTQLSEINVFDYDGILKRALFHLDKSFRHSLPPKNEFDAQREFSKAIFKLSFYLCVYFDKEYQLTSITEITKKMEKLAIENCLDKLPLECLKRALSFRKSGDFGSEFEELRLKFTFYLFSALSTGILHKKLKYEDLILYLKSTFNGLRNLISQMEKLKTSYYKKKQ